MTTFALNPRLQERYDGYWGREAEWHRLAALAKADNIIALCQAHPHGSVLEIGAGDGSILQRLSDLGFGERLYALEVSRSGAEIIKGRGIAALAECRLFDGYEVPYPEGAFDLAVLSHVLEHVEYPRRLLYEAARVARLVYIEVPLEDNRRLPFDYTGDDVGHINFYSAGTIRRLAQTCGLEVLEQRVTNPWRQTYEYRLGRRGTLNYFIKEALLRLAPGLAQRLFTYHSELLAQGGANLMTLTPAAPQKEDISGRSTAPSVPKPSPSLGSSPTQRATTARC